MKKVKYRQRRFIDKYTCTDKIVERHFVYAWVVNGLTYFKKNQFDVFTVATEDIISIED